jgi:AcrR family transcriptional regulator
MPQPARRTQEERTRATRARLLDATIACISEQGYARTTTTEIADRAGVSRGAQLHHFPTKAELVTTAVEHLFARRTDEFRRAVARLPARADRRSAAVDILWSIFSGPTFYAWLELVVAARTDRPLARTVHEISARFMATVDEIFRQLFPAPAAPNLLYDVAPAFTFALLQGLALDRIAARRPSHIKAVLATFKRLAALAIPPRRSS